MSERRLAWFGFLVMFLIGTDTFVVAPLLPTLAADFRVSASQSGWLVSAYALGYATSGVLAGPRSDRGDRKRVLIGGLGVFALATGFCAAAGDFWTMFALRFVAGTAAAVAAPQIWASVPMLVRPDRVLRVMGYATAGLAFAQVAGVPLGSVLAIVDWRIVFPVIGVASAAMAVIGWRWLPGLRAPTGAGLRVPFPALLRTPQLATRLLSYFAYTLAFFTVFTYAPTWLALDLHAALGVIALVVLVGGSGNLIGSLFGSRVTGRLSARAAISWSAALMAACYLALVIAPNAVVVGVVFLPLFAAGGAMLSVRMLHLQQLRPDARGTISSLTSVAMYLATTVAGLIGGPLFTLSGDFTAIAVVAAALTVGSAALIRA